MLKDQADRTPSPQWVRVVGGWSEFQFAERRMPTLEELNDAAPDTPVFVLHLYDRALLNRAALKPWATPKRRRIRRAARSSAIATATRPGC
jgi:predicted amidohydrolase YtcJ